MSAVSKPILQIIVASTRPGRVGLPIAQWVRDEVVKHDAFEAELIDLAELNLPFMDEPNHPRLHQYQNQHTKDWSATVARADAFVFVLAEYNHGYPAPLKNAIDYLHREWQHKPAGFVSYGGVAAGTRAMQMLKPVLAALNMTPLVEAVNIPFVQQSINDEGHFVPDDITETAARVMLDSLVRWNDVLAPLRAAH
jgi:NAD(P)H-dependent FMN reductase